MRSPTSRRAVHRPNADVATARHQKVRQKTYKYITKLSAFSLTDHVHTGNGVAEVMAVVWVFLWQTVSESPDIGDETLVLLLWAQPDDSSWKRG